MTLADALAFLTETTILRLALDLGLWIAFGFLIMERRRSRDLAERLLLYKNALGAYGKHRAGCALFAGALRETAPCSCGLARMLGERDVERRDERYCTRCGAKPGDRCDAGLHS